jgi:hypothetical protein
VAGVQSDMELAYAGLQLCGPLLGIVDDAQWLDQFFGQTLAFVARPTAAGRAGDAPPVSRPRRPG